MGVVGLASRFGIDRGAIGGVKDLYCGGDGGHYVNESGGISASCMPGLTPVLSPIP
jgi:hypothetical protein